jgi:hypothetical protein
MVVLLFLFINILFSEEPKIDFWLETATPQEGMPIQANFIITREASDLIDPAYFRFDQKKIAPSLIAKKKIGPLDVETYQFEIPPLPQGHYHFTGLEAKVGGVVIQGGPLDIEIKPLEKAQAIVSSDVFLEITPVKQIPEKLYPGMEMVLGYRYRFRGAILLKEEVIPLIDKNPFEKIGDKIVEDGTEGSFSTRTITQKFKAALPGDYKISESRIAGYGYHETYGGQKILVEPKLESVIPPFSIGVSPFPEKGKPPFFNGILGPFALKSALLTPPSVQSGESIHFELSFSGAGESQTLAPPDLRGMPGFNYLFSFPEGSPKRDKNQFIYELNPLQTGALSIPEVIIATFIPKGERYEIIHSEPIRIEVAPPIVRSTEQKEKSPDIVMNHIPYVPPAPFGIVEHPPFSLVQELFFSKRVGYFGIVLAAIAFLIIYRKLGERYE